MKSFNSIHRHILLWGLLFSTTLSCLAQDNKEYPLIGKWKAISTSIIPDSNTQDYHVAAFNLEFKLSSSKVSVFFGSITERGLRVDYSDEYNAILKKDLFRNKRSITFKALFPYAGVKGSIRVSLIHPDTLLWETLWLPSNIIANYIPQRAKFIRETSADTLRKITDFKEFLKEIPQHSGDSILPSFSHIVLSFILSLIYLSYQ